MSKDYKLRGKEHPPIQRKGSGNESNELLRLDSSIGAILPAYDYTRKVEQAWDSPRPSTFTQSDIYGLLSYANYLETAQSYYTTSMQIALEASHAQTKLQSIAEPTFGATLPHELKGHLVSYQTHAPVVLSTILNENPAWESNEGAVSLMDIAEMPLVQGKLRDEDREKINVLFADISDPVDMALCSFFLELGKKAGRGIQTTLPGGEKLHFATKSRLAEKLTRISLVANAYFSSYQERLLDAAFTGDTDVLPSDTGMLPVFLAKFAEDRLEILPSSFLSLYREGFIPGLDPELSESILPSQYKKFNERHPSLTSITDLANNKPYALVDFGLQQDEDGSGATNIAQELFQNLPEEPANVSLLQSEFYRKFEQIRGRLTGKCEIVGTFGTDKLPIVMGSNTNGTLPLIDILLIDPQHKAGYPLQIDSRGRVFGFSPREYQSAAVESLLPILETATVHFKSIGMRFEDTQAQPAQPTYAPLRRPGRFLAPTSPAPVEQEASENAQKPLKRKQLQQEGLLIPKTTEQSVSEGSSTRRKEAVTPLVKTPTYLKGLEGLDPSIREIAERAEADLQRGREPKFLAYYSKLMGERMYSMRVTRGYRIILTRGEDGGFVLASIGNRNEIYDETLRKMSIVK